MPIDGGMRKSLAAGMRLVATYRKQEHVAEVIEGEDSKLRFRLADGREFASPSAAGSAVMNGVACNGWRFWSLNTDEATPKAAPAKQPRARAGRGGKPKGRAPAETQEPGDEPSSEPAATENR